MNLLLYPKALQFDRGRPLDPARFQYLEGCVREDEPYTLPTFKKNVDKPLIYIGSGSMNEADVDLNKRQIVLLATLPYRALMSVGNIVDEYGALPGNVHIAPWLPQPSVIPQVDLVVHHGGNNSFNKSLYFGKPVIIMPFFWDGNDNAQRVEDKGYGAQLRRYAWSDEEYAATLERLLNDDAMQARLAEVSTHMQKQDGRAKAADILL